MARSRITAAIRKNAQGEPHGVLIYLNPEGRDELVKELLNLSERSDHFHMLQDEEAEVVLASIPYEADEVLPYEVKVMLRPDSWDQAYFPHVMASEGGK